MESHPQSLKALGFTYQEIGEVLLQILSGENEPMRDFLFDWDDYIHSEDMESRIGYVCMNKLTMQTTTEFQQLLKIAHSFVLHCQRSRYLETGEDCHPFMTIAEFLKEIFYRYHASIKR